MKSLIIRAIIAGLLLLLVSKGNGWALLVGIIPLTFLLPTTFAWGRLVSSGFLLVLVWAFTSHYPGGFSALRTTGSKGVTTLGLVVEDLADKTGRAVKRQTHRMDSVCLEVEVDISSPNVRFSKTLNWEVPKGARVHFYHPPNPTTSTVTWVPQVAVYYDVSKATEKDLRLVSPYAYLKSDHSIGGAKNSGRKRGEVEWGTPARGLFSDVPKRIIEFEVSSTTAPVRPYVGVRVMYPDGNGPMELPDPADVGADKVWECQ